jgi:tetratricopeptide (TPR) repeat protein
LVRRYHEQFHWPLAAAMLLLLAEMFLPERYNLGNTLYRLGELKFEPDTEGLNALEESWQRAVKSYEHAAELNTNDTDVACNLAFVKKQIGLIAQLREAMRRAKAAADEAVRRNEYHRALEIMESLNQSDCRQKIPGLHQKIKGHRCDCYSQPALACCCCHCRRLAPKLPADDFFNSGAQCYISNNIAQAKESVARRAEAYVSG